LLGSPLNRQLPPATPRGRRTDRHVARGAGCLSPASEL